MKRTLIALLFSVMALVIAGMVGLQFLGDVTGTGIQKLYSDANCRDGTSDECRRMIEQLKLH